MKNESYKYTMDAEQYLINSKIKNYNIRLDAVYIVLFPNEKIELTDIIMGLESLTKPFIEIIIKNYKGTTLITLKWEKYIVTEIPFGELFFKLNKTKGDIMKHIKLRQKEKVQGLQNILKLRKDNKKTRGKATFTDEFYDEIERSLKKEMNNTDNMQYLNRQMKKYLKK